MNPRQQNKRCTSPHPSVRQGVVLWLCSARALSVFASTCRCAMKIVEQDTLLGTCHRATCCRYVAQDAAGRLVQVVSLGKRCEERKPPTDSEEREGRSSLCIFFLIIFSPRATVKGFPCSCPSVCGGLSGVRPLLLHLSLWLAQKGVPDKARTPTWCGLQHHWKDSPVPRYSEDV